jgi:hypothetical protein
MIDEPGFISRSTLMVSGLDQQRTRGGIIQASHAPKTEGHALVGHTDCRVDGGARDLNTPSQAPSDGRSVVGSETVEPERRRQVNDLHHAFLQPGVTI